MKDTFLISRCLSLVFFSKTKNKNKFKNKFYLLLVSDSQKQRLIFLSGQEHCRDPTPVGNSKNETLATLMHLSMQTLISF